ncbi:MAG TPA: hypothetical protein VIZ68_02095 [Thermoplasmata archaeon]
MTGTVRFSLTVRVAADPAEVRHWTVRSVTGDGGVPVRGGRLEPLEEGPDRFASRYLGGDVDQLRVVEWAGVDSAYGAIEVTVGGQLRLTARFRLEVRPVESGSEVVAHYVVESPLFGLGIALQLTPTRSLARRVARSWLRVEDPSVWRNAIVHRDRSVGRT